ncbi:MAG: hypothetical protein ACXWNR_05670 [Candidatus Limnocylindrales bacterium]
MRRAVPALAAGMLLVALLPGAAMGSPLPPGALDQSNDPAPGAAHTIGTPGSIAQTFTVGKTGLLTRIQLYVNGTGPMTVSVNPTSGGLPTGAPLASSTSGFTSFEGWLDFPFASPVSVTAGVKYAIVFNTGTLAAAWGSLDTYSGGQALIFTSSWVSFQDWQATSTFYDFAFKTFVDPQTTAVAWDKAQVTAGASTSLTMTETVVFPAYAVLLLNVTPNAGPATWTVKLNPLPTWFAVTGVACSPQVADCTLVGVLSASGSLVAPNGNPIVLTFTGTASPALADAGTPGVALGGGCVNYGASAPQVGVAPAADGVQCVQATANVAVVAPAANPTPTPAPTPAPAPTPTPRPTITPPPTATGGSGSSGAPGFPLWLLPIGLIAVIGGGGLLVKWQPRRLQ